MEKKIAMFDTKPYDREAFEQAQASYLFNITYFESRLTAETAQLAKNFPVVCLFVHDVVDANIADILIHQNVKLLALRSSGYNHINLDATRDFMKVVRVPRYSPYAVAEYTIALLLCLNRKVHQAYWRTRMNNFSLVNLQGFDMHGKTAGVIGTGQIGAIVVQLLTAFGMRVLAYDTTQNDTLVSETNCMYTDLDTLYKESDIITLHCPLLPETHHMINKESIEKMKDGVVFINTSRGGLINTHDFIEALKSKKIGAAGLDVYEEEERFFFNDLSGTFIDDDTLARLMTFPNVLISGHQAFFTKEALEQIAKTTLENCKCFFDGKPIQNEVVYAKTK